MIRTCHRAFLVMVSTTMIGIVSSSVTVAQQLQDAPDNEDIQFRRLAGILDRASTVSAFKFEEPCFKCRVRDLSAGTVLKDVSPVPLDGFDAVHLKRIIGSRSSYLFGVTKPCGPFIANYGVVFNTPSDRAIFLISSSCAWGRLVFDEPVTLNLFNLRDAALQELQAHLDHLLADRKGR